MSVESIAGRLLKVSEGLDELTEELRTAEPDEAPFPGCDVEFMQLAKSWRDFSRALHNSEGAK